MFKFLRNASNRRRKGAIAVLAVVAILPITAMVSAHVNTGQMMEDRRRTQDAADSLAIMHATWTARSLNVISMNNVTATQMMTVAIGSQALEATLLELRATIRKTEGWIALQDVKCAALATGVVTAPLAKACLKWNDWALRKPLKPFKWYANLIDLYYAPAWGIARSEKALGAIDRMNSKIVERFPEAMRDIGKDYAKLLRIDDFHFVTHCLEEGTCGRRRQGQGMALPVKPQMVPLDFCEGMLHGSKSLAPIIEARKSFRERGFAANHGPMGNGGRGRTHVREHIVNVTKIDFVMKAYKFYYSIVWAKPTFSRLPRRFNIQGQQSYRDNTFTRSFDSKLTTVCPHVNKASTFSGYHARWALSAYIGTRPETFVSVGRKQNTPGPRKAQSMHDAYRVLAIAQVKPSRHLSAKLLSSRSIPHYGYGQATVHNPDGADLYTQAWRAKLTEASRMEKPDDVARDLDRHASNAFKPLVHALKGVRHLSSWGKINAH